MTLPPEKNSVGIIGTGPMGVYTLKELIKDAEPRRITLFEASAQVGCGMPYRSGMNADFMYCNAFSREIPPITQGLAHWLKAQDDGFLSRWELTTEEVDAREFYPRVLLGAYMKAEFEALCEKGRRAGHAITVLPRHRVTDILVRDDGGVTCKVQSPSGEMEHDFFKLVIATGHDWPENPVIEDAPLISPWPYTNITDLKPGRIGILGSSLSAIDVAAALAKEHGTFAEDGNAVRWFPKDNAGQLKITMVSHKGIMPEPDFHYPYPYAPLKHIHPEAVAADVAKGVDGLLDRVFGLLLAELEEADPRYLADLGPDAASVEGFGESYFDRRERLGGLKSLRRTLDEAVRSIRDKETIASRYALLRGHENFDIALRHLSEDDWQRFMDKLMPVFADCYAAIPHVSVQRILALYDAGVLDIVPTGPDSSFGKTQAGVTVTTADGAVTFDAIVDARGQAPSPVADLPFPSLVMQLKEPHAPLTGPFWLPVSSRNTHSVICLAMPQVLERYPFSQGLPNCSELAKTAVQALSE